MTNLTGSEKQINWAEKIRNGLLPQFEKYVNEKTALATAEQKAKPLAFIAWLQNQTEASFWIENKKAYDNEHAWDLVNCFNWFVQKWVAGGCK